MTPEGLFGPTVMFFDFTNSPAIFQMMINKILQNLINTEKIASFIDDIIVGTEEEKGHDEMIEKIVKRLALYEKYKWKVRKIGFLEVVIGLEKIKIEKEKEK